MDDRPKPSSITDTDDKWIDNSSVSTVELDDDDLSGSWQSAKNLDGAANQYQYNIPDAQSTNLSSPSYKPVEHSSGKEKAVSYSNSNIHRTDSSDNLATENRTTILNGDERFSETDPSQSSDNIDDQIKNVNRRNVDTNHQAVAGGGGGDDDHFTHNGASLMKVSTAATGDDSTESPSYPTVDNNLNNNARNTHNNSNADRSGMAAERARTRNTIDKTHTRAAATNSPAAASTSSVDPSLLGGGDGRGHGTRSDDRSLREDDAKLYQKYFSAKDKQDATSVADNWPEEVHLYQPYPGQMTLFETAHCLAVTTYLEMCSLSFSIKFRSNARDMSPSGSVPFLAVNDLLIAEPGPIYSFIRSRRRAVSKTLSKAQMATVKGLISFSDRHLGQFANLFCWGQEDVYKNWTKPRFGTVYPWPLNHLLPFLERRRIKERLSFSATIKSHSLDEAMEDVSRQCLASLDSRLNNQKFLLGEQQCEADAHIFGYLYVLATLDISLPSPPSGGKKTGDRDKTATTASSSPLAMGDTILKHSNIANYLHAMQERYLANDDFWY